MKPADVKNQSLTRHNYAAKSSVRSTFFGGYNTGIQFSNPGQRNNVGHISPCSVPYYTVTVIFPRVTRGPH